MNEPQSSRTQPGAHPVAAPLASGPFKATRKENRGGFWLVVFMRILAVLWIAQGLWQWGALLLSPEPVLDNGHATQGAAVVVFAVLDPIAAVGLWLAAPWGGALWLLSALAQAVSILVVPGLFSPLWAAADLLLIGVYFFLIWRASRRTAGHA